MWNTASFVAQPRAVTKPSATKEMEMCSVNGPLMFLTEIIFGETGPESFPQVTLSPLTPQQVGVTSQRSTLIDEHNQLNKTSIFKVFICYLLSWD